MSALTETDRITIIEARTLARADSRTELIDALSLAGSPTIAGRTADELASVGLDVLHAAAFGTLSAMTEYLAEKLEALATRADNLAAERNAAVVTVTAAIHDWAIWRVDEGTGMAREMGHLDRGAAEAMTVALNRDCSKRPVHFMALPLGGEPFDTPDRYRNPWYSLPGEYQAKAQS